VANELRELKRIPNPQFIRFNSRQFVGHSLSPFVSFVLLRFDCFDFEQEASEGESPRSVFFAFFVVDGLRGETAEITKNAKEVAGGDSSPKRLRQRRLMYFVDHISGSGFNRAGKRAGG
jgi:hypothetical protein